MSKLLIVKCGAAGDVVRTTPLLRLFDRWEIDWLTAPESSPLVPVQRLRRAAETPLQISADEEYDLLINLEDDVEFVARVHSRVRSKRVFGSFIANGRISYSSDSAAWFDIGLASRFGVKQADKLKLDNRKSYQELIFEGLGFPFRGEAYILPEGIPPSPLKGDIAIAPKAGARWPAKNWHFADRLIEDLRARYTVNVLPPRATTVEHIADIRGHRFLISGDSLPMHVALGLQIPCVAWFTCTSPWEIYDYGLLTKLVSPELERHFYSRQANEAASRAISYDAAFRAVTAALSRWGL